MKIIIPLMSILMVLFLLSCKESEETTELRDVQSQQQKITVGNDEAKVFSLSIKTRGGSI